MDLMDMTDELDASRAARTLVAHFGAGAFNEAVRRVVRLRGMGARRSVDLWVAIAREVDRF